MNEKQKKLLDLLDTKDFNKLTLRDIAKLLGLEKANPQAAKYHIEQLQKKGLITINSESGVIHKTKIESKKEGSVVSIPIIGSANCGTANICAEERFEGFLRISQSLLKKTKNIFAIRAHGDSMNSANIDGKNIEDGDYVLIDTNDKNIKDKDYVLSTIEGMANIKKIVFDKDNNQVVLFSESNQKYPPIIIDGKESLSYIVNGKVFQVIKVPKV